MTAIWAHRGASGDAPENTLEAFELARDMGADGVELDVQFTRDGEIVVCHDETIDRTSNGSGVIKNMTLEQLREYDFSSSMPGFSGVKIPTLRDVYELLRPTGMAINVELKNSIEPYPGMAEAIEALTATMNMVFQVSYSSFNHYSLRDIAHNGTMIPLGLLHSDMLIDPWVYGAEIGVKAMHPHWGLVALDDRYVPESHARGLKVNVWTANDSEHIDLMLQRGVDAIITNHPDKALALRG